MGMVGCKAEKREIGSWLIFNENMQICSGSESLSFFFLLLLFFFL